MPASVLEALSLLARWAHVALAIAWLGAALYFAWRDRVEPAKDPSGPGEHLVMWQAYWTWLTGFALLVLIYYVNAELYLVDPAVMPLSKWAAIGASVAILVGALALYEGLCRAPLSEGALVVVLLFFFAALAWGLAQLFSGRGAFIHYGAVLGTIMSGNVAHATIPARRRALLALREGRTPDAKDVNRMRQRLAHNAYFVPGVVFAMISSHYPMTFAHRWSWLVPVGATLVGVLARGGWVQRALGAACAVALALLVLPAADRGVGTASFEQIQPVIEQHCASCHAQKPSFPGMLEAPKGVMLDTPERVLARAEGIRQQAVLTRAMPPGNITRMTERERELLKRWVRGAR